MKPGLPTDASTPFAGADLAVRNTPPESRPMSLLGMDYFHIKTRDGGELYLTQFGLPFWKHLLPENWYAPDWFETRKLRLLGTSMVYKLPTRSVDGTALDLVVKWSRVGEEIPVDTLTVQKFIHAEFNSPFEEFSLLMELRRGDGTRPGFRIRTQKPLAIYVPGRRLQLWQTGRSESKIKAKILRHPSVEIDILRQYVVLYGWVKGLDAVETAEYLRLENHDRTAFLAHTTTLVTHELAQKGYRVIDMKPAHVILRPRPDGSLLRERNGQLAYALVDYELLERTQEHEQAVRSLHRQVYFEHMARRFEADHSKPIPPHLQQTTILGVDYIFGRAESTGGLLWVAGKDPDLFNYFLPERWRRTPNRKLSARNQVFATQTKDNINLVWKVSRVGDRPWINGPPSRTEDAPAHGFNSPFEEFAFALELHRNGVPTVYPRAIYMTGDTRENLRQVSDRRHYDRMRGCLTPEGDPVLRDDHDYITLWGFWKGPDRGHAGAITACRTMNVRQALANGLITEETAREIMRWHLSRLARCDFDDLNPKPDHLLIAFDDSNQLIRGWTGRPEGHLCNFELIRQKTG